ncbi:hypothetical protein [Carboxylicivirga taeanensis]|jgi:hypothetical protein|uniref:hypothetical protein n=1 Tax=Carboxylicivirga taeanensis TaxID=1416875 RepID=UPI003F6E2160
MIDRDKIPEQTYNELIDLLGYDKAEEFLNREQYNFRAIQMKILSESMKRRFGKRFWIYFWIIALVIAIIYEILRANYLI